MEIFTQLLNQDVPYSLTGYIEKEYMEGSIQWWKNSYLVTIEQRELKYISEEDIIKFVDIATREIIAELKTLL